MTKIPLVLLFGFLVMPGLPAVKTIPIYADAWAGSSVNVLANQSNTLITDGDYQFAAFYAADHHLVLARRTLKDDTWETRKSNYTGNVADAHDTVSIAVDGEGFLHVAWNHHASPLNYCRSVSPHSLELGPKRAMTGLLEKSVTYPLFFRQSDGGLLFLYRDGRSGQGNVVLNRYELKSHEWHQLHDNLIDGEGARSAYLAAALDARGALHLAWNWRESPDVATNHDLCYATSPDGGQTWINTSGKPLALPLTAKTTEYALRIPQKSTLMNPPSLTTDADGHPFIVTYWAPVGTGVPQFHLVRYDGSKWSVSQITHRTQSFSLEGTATKRPPISRAVVLAGRGTDGIPAVCLVYRDDERGGRVILTTGSRPDATDWQESELTTQSLGAWEPSVDIAQWTRFGQIHMLIQDVQQQDGNDAKPKNVPPGPISTLIWTADAAR
jgi:hypothetical protein